MSDMCTPSSHADTLPPNYRWNFRVFLVDYAAFGIAMALIGIDSVIPTFVSTLTDSAPVIGMATTIFRSSWMLPQLVVARLIQDKAQKKPTMIASMSGRITMWIIALALWLGLGRHPKAMLILFFSCLGLFAVSDGVTSVAWFDILSRAIPSSRRSRLIGLAQLVVGVVGIGVGALITLIMGAPNLQDPARYAILFTAAGALFTISTLAVAMIKEPSPKKTDRQTNGPPKGNWLKFLITDPTFLRLMLSRVLVAMIGLASPFYTLHAREALHLPERTLGIFVLAQTLGGMIASATLGLAGERRGTHVVIRVGSAAAVLSPLIALAAHLTNVHVAGSDWTALVYPLVFAMLGAVNSIWMLGFLNYLMEIAPEGWCPAYLGTSNMIVGVLTVMPMLGGWLLEETSYTVLFIVTAVFAAAGFLLSLGLGPTRPAAAHTGEIG